MDTCTVGLDLGGTFIKGAAVNAGGEIFAWERVPTHREMGIGGVLDRIEALIDTLARKVSGVSAVGLGVPGMLDPARKKVLLAPNLGWKHVDLKELLEHRLRVPVFLDNDANLAALGEWWLGSARNADCFLMATIGTGIGSGMVLGGGLYRGSNGLAPELGHMTVVPDGPLCRCGQRGCLETLISAPAILHLAEEKGLHLPEKAGAKDVFDLMDKGDTVARQVIVQAMEFLAVGLKNVIVLLDPQLILIGGGIGDSSAGFLDRLRARVMELLPVKREVTIAKAALGNKAGALGAARLAFVELQEVASSMEKSEKTFFPGDV